MGHREYSVKDPRANILTDMVQELFHEREGGVTDIFEKAIELEKACEEKLAHKGVYPNVDFYSGILYKRWVYQQIYLHQFLQCHEYQVGLLIGLSRFKIIKYSDPQNYVGSDDRAYKDINDR